MGELEEFLDDTFHGCAFAAYVEEAFLSGGSPCPQKTRIRAYRYYEAELASRNARRTACPQPVNEAHEI